MCAKGRGEDNQPGHSSMCKRLHGQELDWDREDPRVDHRLGHKPLHQPQGARLPQLQLSRLSRWCPKVKTLPSPASPHLRETFSG